MEQYVIIIMCVIRLGRRQLKLCAGHGALSFIAFSQVYSIHCDAMSSSAVVLSWRGPIVEQ